MSVYHDEIEIEDMEFDEENQLYHYPCPCGDRFIITLDDLKAGEEVAQCPSCSLLIKIVYDHAMFSSESLQQINTQPSTIETC